MNGSEAVGEEFDFLVPDSGVGDIPNLLIPEDGDPRHVVQGEEEVREAKQEEPALVCGLGCSSGLALYGGIVLFCLVAEPAPNKDSLPA